jgi:DNA repair exonuclease SbcCD ATPase subunit
MLVRLVLTNFMNVEFAEITGAEGINAFIGRNGQGKSAAFEAVAFVLLDRKKGEAYKDYVKLGGKTARVQLEWLIGTESCFFDYEISRTSGSVSRSIQFGETRHSGTEDCQKFVEDHFDLKMLRDIIFNLQDSESVIKMTPSDRREVLQKIFNVNFEQGLSSLKKDSEAIDEKVKLVTARKTALSEKSYPFMRLEKIEDDEKYHDFMLEKSTTESRLSKIEDLSEIKTRVAGQSNLVSQYARQLSDLESTMASNDNLIQRLSGDIDSQSSSIPATRTKIADLEKEIADLSGKKKSRIDPEEFSVLEKEIADCRGELSLVSKQLVMHRKGLCDSCGQACDPKHTSELEQKETKYKTKTANAETSLADLRKQDKEIQEILSSIVMKENDLKTLVNRVTNTEELIARYQSEKDRAKDMMVNLEIKKTDLQKQKSDAEEVYRKYLSEFELKNEDQKEIEPLRQKIAELDSKIKRIEAGRISNNERTRMNESLEQQQKADKVEIETMSLSEQQYIEELLVLKQTKTIIETVLPDFILAQACTILDNFINQFIASTGMDLKVKLIATSTAKRSKGVQFFYLSHSEGKEFPEWLPVSMASGYEEALLTLGFKLAIAFMWGAPILLLDEPDKAATEENSLVLFKHIANIEGFRQIFLISHREPLIDWIKTEADAHIYRVENGAYEEAV